MPEAADLIDRHSLEPLPSATLTSDSGHPVAPQMPSSSMHEISLNLISHPALLGRLPALHTAFDPALMQERLQHSLLDPQQGATIESCTPGKAFYDSGDQLLMQYALKVRHGEQRFSLVVNAVLFSSTSASKRYYRQQVTPLVQATLSRPEFSSLKTSAALFSDLAMVIAVFPIDGLLPTLTGATDMTAMRPILGESYRKATGETFPLDQVRIELAHYGRFKRCVLRYWLDGGDAAPAEKRLRLVYGKVDGENANQQALQATTALTDLGARQNLFRVPHIYAAIPALKLVLMEAIPGDAIFSRLLKTRVHGDGTPRIDEPLLEDAIIHAARVASALHASSISIGEQRTFTQDVASLRSSLNRIQQILPEVGSRLLTGLDQVIATTQGREPLPLRFCHGDFTYTQFIYSQGETGLVDFDNLCQAEPALDLGQFLAYLRLNIRKEELPGQPFPAQAIDQLASIFLNAYLETSQPWLQDVSVLRKRIYAYELLSYLRLAVHSWQKLKGSRLIHAMNLFEERMPCLKRVS